MDSYEREERGTDGRSSRDTTEFVCKNVVCEDYDRAFRVRAVRDETGAYVDGDTSCPTCGTDGEAC